MQTRFIVICPPLNTLSVSHEYFSLRVCRFLFRRTGGGFWADRAESESYPKHEKEVPAYFREKITPTEYQKSIAYNREKAWFGIISSWIEVPIFWGLLLSGFFGRVDDWVRSFQAGSISDRAVLFCPNDGSLLRHFAPIQPLRNLMDRTEIRIQPNDLENLGDGSGKGDILVGFDWRSCPGWRSVVDGSFPRASLVDLGMGLAGRDTAVLQAIFPVVIVPLFNRLTPLPEGSLRDADPHADKKGGFQNLWNFYDGWIQKINPLQRLFCRNRGGFAASSCLTRWLLYSGRKNFFRYSPMK